MEHPPYSPDIAPSDFYLFRCLQNHLSESKFRTAEEMKKEVTDFLTSRNSVFFEEGIYKLVDRWKEVVAQNGEYLTDCHAAIRDRKRE
jgi:histone-lysine N-methyltransferase SETMAR